MALPSGAAQIEAVAPSVQEGSAADGPATRWPVGRRPTIQLAASSDSGVSRSDRITNETKLVFIGRAKPNSTVVITENSRGLAQGRASKDGFFEISLPSLTDGQRLFAAAQLIRPGVGLFSKEISITIDTKPPSPPRLDLNWKPKTFNNGSAIISGQVGEKGGGVTVYEGKTRLAEVWAERNRTRWASEAIAFSGGTHMIHAVGIDRAGNVSKPSGTAALLLSVEQRHLDLAGLDRRTGLTVRGDGLRDEAGYDVAAIGDVNGDGLDDMAIGAPGARAGNNWPGRTYILFGTRSPLPAQLDLSRIGGNFGVVLSGGRYDSRVGSVISSAGDLNNDGIDDVLLGTARYGKGYILFGRRSWPAEVELGRIKAGEGVELSGDADSCIGGSLSGGGDVNGDGMDDVAIGCGSRVEVFSPAGRAYIIYGRDTPFPKQLNLKSLDGRYGVQLLGEDRQFGYSVSISSDLNADGIDDVVVSEPRFNKNASVLGGVHVLFGKRGGFGKGKKLGSLKEGEGLYLTGVLSWRQFGHSLVGNVSGGGDLNSDGIDDLAITLESDSLSDKVVAGFVVFGSRKLAKAPPSLSNLDGRDGFRVAMRHQDLSSRGALLKISEDVNGDGRADLVAGFARAGQTTGASYVLFGTHTYPSIISLTAIGPKDGFVVDGADREDFSGVSIAGVGDLNGDGIGDIAIGAPGVGDSNQPIGMAYVVFGRDRN